ncbi:acetyltransferase component of pyruvate dehydrogenase complex [Agromyces rhizosphaerae]|uniref:Dihydrolipoamide acetyltransferase component of pyruvate dehydrogenase complex n=1 Tax=Agromyces rhizosphaerae TaxID=88374 RepID=A0A9W6CQA0_9MICO|nr:dihydrolipoamide acetyltransferase family protein [Agromyces rhizosphaerae]GLI26548.1 acetyltransferase component of pyruvate dehydrogenase complex [Agromyces rhizosphaerae]
MATTVRMPEVLTGVTEAAIQTWLVEPGQEVAVGTPIAEVETDKAVVEYAAEVAGTVLEVLVDAGDPVAIGDPIAVIGAPGESAAPDEPGPDEAAPAETADASAPAPAPAPARAAPSAPAASNGHDADAPRRFLSPIVRRLVREWDLDLTGVDGSGPGGRVVRRDVDALVAERREAASAPAAPAAAPTAPAAAPAAATPAPAADDASVEEVPLTGMRRAIARRLAESKSTVPHFYVEADCRVDRLLELRRQVNEASPVRVSVNDFVLKAVAGALVDVPDANATWGETVIHRHRSVDVAVAVAIDGGLVTPVLRGVDRMSLSEVHATVADLAERARAGRLKQHELEGGSFSVSNLGMYGVSAFSAIINPPHAGILAVGAARQVPVVEDGELAVGTVMTVTLSADHRVVDGAVGAEWLQAFVRRIENPLSILV